MFFQWPGQIFGFGCVCQLYLIQQRLTAGCSTSLEHRFEAFCIFHLVWNPWFCTACILSHKEQSCLNWVPVTERNQLNTIWSNNCKYNQHNTILRLCKHAAGIVVAYSPIIIFFTIILTIPSLQTLINPFIRFSIKFNPSLLSDTSILTRAPWHCYLLSFPLD